MYHVITESNSWKKDFCMEKFGVQKEKEGGKGGNSHSKANK